MQSPEAVLKLLETFKSLDKSMDRMMLVRTAARTTLSFTFGPGEPIPCRGGDLRGPSLSRDASALPERAESRLVWP